MAIFHRKLLVYQRVNLDVNLLRKFQSNPIQGYWHDYSQALISKQKKLKTYERQRRLTLAHRSLKVLVACGCVLFHARGLSNDEPISPTIDALLTQHWLLIYWLVVLTILKV